MTSHQPGTNIRMLREHLRLTQRQLAAKSGVDIGTISNIENGKQNYAQSNLEPIARALGVSAGTLLEDGATLEAATFGMRRVPLLTESQMLAWRGGPIPADEIKDQEYLHEHLTRASEHAFAIRLANDANAPDYRKGYDVIFDARMQPHPAALVIATTPQEVFIGRFRDLGVVEKIWRFEVVPVNPYFAKASVTEVRGLTLRGTAVSFRGPVV